MESRFYYLLIAVLAAWRVTHLLNAEDGPWDLVVRLRRIAGSGFFGKLLDCFYCLSLWIAAPLGLIGGSEWKERLLLWLAISAGAVLCERAASSAPQATPTYFEDQEESDVLRK
jgi:hypothetical protein